MDAYVPVGIEYRLALQDSLVLEVVDARLLALEPLLALVAGSGIEEAVNIDACHLRIFNMLLELGGVVLRQLV